MKISSIEIFNFRSIDHIDIPIIKVSNKSCQIFLGKNETGKSNILKAISILDDTFPINYASDCNKKAKKKKEKIKITLNLKFENFGYYQKKFDEIGIPKSIQNKIKPYKVQRHVEVSNDDDRKDYIHIWINEFDEISKYLYDNSSSTIKLISELYSEDEELTKDNVKVKLGESFSLLTKAKLETLLEAKLYSSIARNTPTPVLWRPSSEFLINEHIDLNEFAKNQTISIPLKNIFKISNIENIEERLELIKDDIEERSQLKQELSNSITQYINEKWPEHKINIHIEIENMTCSVMVEDKDDSIPKYRMDQRSDGFQQFISILLNLSIENRTEEIKNKIILLDEPEIHLHPSGVKYLRDELLKISENNIVLVSSHSIYMVDKLNLDRHFKVYKEKSVSSIKQIEENNPYEEEVVYEALGTSVYEHVQPNMLIFEGKTDKDLFDGFLTKFKRDVKPVSIGTISADGVEKIPQYVKFMEGKLVKGFVLVDSDPDGIRIKELVKNESKFFNTKNTFEINDILKTNKASTLEDLYPIEHVTSTITNKFDINVELDSTKPFIKQLELKNKALKGKLHIKDLKGYLVNEILTDIKKLTKDECKDKYSSYYNFFVTLNDKLKK